MVTETDCNQAGAEAIALRDCPGKKVVAKEKPRTADPVKNGSLCGVL